MQDCRIPYKKTQEKNITHLMRGKSILLDLGIYPISLSNKIVKLKNLDILFKCSEKNKRRNEITQNIILSYDKKTIFNLAWGIDNSYKNEVEILGKNWCLSTDRIFSKTESFKPSN